jgi:hypothetical protein
MVKQVTAIVDVPAVAAAHVTAPETAHDSAHAHGARLLLQPGFLLNVVLFAFLGSSMRSLAVDNTSTTAGAVASTPAYVAVFTLVFLALTAVHEAAHGIAASAYGHRLLHVRVGLKFGVSMYGDHTRASMVVSAAAGPVIGTLASLAVMAPASTWSAIWTAGLVSVLMNVANVALFFMPGSDGAQIVSALRRTHPAVTV